MLKKDITFIYSDEVEKQVFEMIAREASARGYQTRLTDDKFAVCEIGWYCQHVNFPQYSKFSIIMLHDITQQYSHWPDLWMREPWNLYDVGFLPSKVWVENWNQCSQYAYANPRKGMYLTGWPKADRLSAYLDPEKKREYARSIGLDETKPTVLYAPAWENDNKQDEFVQAMLPLDVNILVKQAPWPNTFADQLKNIAEMRELHKNNPRVIQLDPKTSILDAIMVSDLLVSEESSTMCESVMLGKPAISVCDWLIPDETPSRLPSDDYEFTIKTKKAELSDCVRRVLGDYPRYAAEAQAYSDGHFSNLGCCIPIMLDILDAYVEDKPCPYARLEPAARKPLSAKQALEHELIYRKKKFLNHDVVKNPVLGTIWSGYRLVKRAVKRPHGGVEDGEKSAQLPIKLELPEDFLQAEDRDGYPVTKEIKALWAVELDLLRELLSFCKENDITVYAGYGTLLGAVRHKGFIPWDDDIDVLMKREDYERFCAIARFEPPYFLQTEYTDQGFMRPFARLRNSSTTAIQAYEKDYKIPYNQGIFIDIFPLDYMPDSLEERKKAAQAHDAIKLRALRYSVFTFRPDLRKGGPKLLLKRGVSAVSTPVLKVFKVHNPHTVKIDRMLSAHAKTGKLGIYWFYEPEKDNCYDAADFDAIELKEFEMLALPAPAGFARVLQNEYGDWETPVMAPNDHGELIVDPFVPYTQFQKKQQSGSSRG